MQPLDPDPLPALLANLRVWARDLPSQGSERYGALCEGLATDPNRASLILGARPGFQNPLILFAAVHHLLLTGATHPLSAYYATLVGEAARTIDPDLYTAFAGFVDEHRDAIEELVRSRTTQTNEARRTVVTLPALGLVQHESGVPLALIDVGASAGLTLLPDRYRYQVGGVDAGDPDSPVIIECDLAGDLRPPIPDRVEVGWRRGLDLNPLDVRDAETRAWLRALIWPEHPDRLALLDAALRVARDEPPIVEQGDLVDDLPRVLAAAPHDASLVVTSTWTLAYLEPDRRRAFVATLADQAQAAQRTIWLVAGEGEAVLASLEVGIGQMPADGFGPSTLSLHRFEPDGARDNRLLAETHPHGRWIRWLDAATAAGPA